jgi:RNA polymerase sigma factor (sigma-70 family)
MIDRDTQLLLRDLAPRVLGAVVRRHGDFAACEDAVQEALLAAATQWPKEGVPANPRGWLVVAASRRMIDRIRAEAARRRREERVAAEEQEVEQMSGAEEHDDTLELLFLCCHPALTTASAIALTLRAVGGLTTAEIANAFFVPEATMAQRISRAKANIKETGAVFQLAAPLAPSELAARLGVVKHVLYLVFNEGYAASSGTDVVRADLSTEAIRLTRALARLLPNDAEIEGLLALMLLTDARRAARSGKDGELVPLDKQDRATWDRARIDEGKALLARAFARGAVGPYQLQAAIAALHDEAPSTDETDWPQIAALYAVLMRMPGMADNPMVALNHAIAAAMVEGPVAGLARVDALAKDPRLQGHHRIDAVRAHLLERAGDRAGAIASFRTAAARTTSIAERDYLVRQAARLEAE